MSEVLLEKAQAITGVIAFNGIYCKGIPELMGADAV
jgi:hypothetical protein